MVGYWRGEAERWAARLGVSLSADWTGSRFQIDVDAPFGERFACSSIHMLTAGARGKRSTATTEPAYRDIAERLAYGLEPCDEPECDYCHPIESKEASNDG